jgi:sterol desaturase/sphingolipid hydroxylase (fatty acid hydroxylase superfamily)
MESNWRIIALGSWLLILWIWENLSPLRTHDRKHFWANTLFSLSTIVINALLVIVLIAIIDFNKNNGFGINNFIETPYWLQLIVGLFILDLVAAYLSHYVMHQYGLLWSFHKIHHLDEMIDVSSGLRQHPLETVYRFGFLLAGVTVLGVPLSVVVIYQTISALNALFEHSNIRLNRKLDDLLNLIIVTPNAHKVHHSSEQQYTDSNYGNIFSIWDRMFGTYKRIENVEEIEYGLGSTKDEGMNNFKKLMSLPFRRRKSKQRDLKKKGTRIFHQRMN